jgi:hypothetical protein
MVIRYWLLVSWQFGSDSGIGLNRGQNTEVRDQRSEVRGQKTEENEVGSGNAEVGKAEQRSNIEMLRSEIFNLLTAFCHLPRMKH